MAGGGVVCLHLRKSMGKTYETMRVAHGAQRELRWFAHDR